MRSVTYCECNVTNRGVGLIPSVTKEFFREMYYLYCPEAMPTIEMFHGVTGSTSRLGLGFCGFDSWRERLFFSARVFFPSVTQFSGSACSPGQVSMWMLHHRCGDMFCVGTLRCT